MTNEQNLEKQLKPCPLCGGAAKVLEIWYSRYKETTVVRCEACGLQLSWAVPGQIVMTLKGTRFDPAGGISAVEAWNRRAQDAERAAEGMQG